jgi:hypothetical protein
MKNKLLLGAFGATLGFLGVSAASAATLDDVKAKGFIQCGVSETSRIIGRASTSIFVGPWLVQSSEMDRK